MKSRLIALLAILAMVVAACGGDDSGASTTEAPDTTQPATETTEPATDTTEPATDTTEAMDGVACDEPITVGVIGDFTGPLAIYGAHVARGMPIGFAYATGGEPQTGEEQTYTLDDCELRVLTRDDQSDPEIAATAARELIEVEGAEVLIGSISSGVTATLQGIAAENDVILIVPAAAATDITAKDFNENTFRTSRSNYQDGMAICDQFVNGNGYKTFVQIAPDYSFGYGGAQAYEDACTFYGGEFLADPVFAPADTTDFTTYLEPFAGTDADAFLVTWAGGGFVPLLQAAIDLGVIDDDTVLGSPFVDNVVMPSFFGNAVGTTSVILYHYTLPDNEVNDYLVTQAEAMGAVPDLFDPDAMDAAIFLVEALRATGGSAAPGDLKAVMEGMTFEGPKGTVEIRAEDHVAIQDIYVVTLTGFGDAGPEYEYVATVRPEPPCLLEGDFIDRCGDLPVGSLGG
ncbi:MAG TPA: ABC transporter substrate-binding protein [Acidimicrobiia bacterium]|nr:ABC transporter substrate-binding protein [Acidimicrobiia bacterium]